MLCHNRQANIDNLNQNRLPRPGNEAHLHSQGLNWQSPSLTLRLRSGRRSLLECNRLSVVNEANDSVPTSLFPASTPRLDSERRAPCVSKVCHRSLTSHQVVSHAPYRSRRLFQSEPLARPPHRRDGGHEVARVLRRSCVEQAAAHGTDRAV